MKETTVRIPKKLKKSIEELKYELKKTSIAKVIQFLFDSWNKLKEEKQLLLIENQELKNEVESLRVDNISYRSAYEDVSNELISIKMKQTETKPIEKDYHREEPEIIKAEVKEG